LSHTSTTIVGGATANADNQLAAAGIKGGAN
jgi:hypothetical protein